MILLKGLRLILQWRCQPLPALRSPVWIIAPHPDDETFGCGAWIADHAEKVDIQIIFLTSGEASHEEDSSCGKSGLAAIRESEAKSAAQRLGIQESRLHFMRYPDGHLCDEATEAVNELVATLQGMMDHLRPCTILLPWRKDGSSEHQGAFRILTCVITRCRDLKPMILEFPVWSAWSPRLLWQLLREPGFCYGYRTPSGTEAKRRAIEEYASQVKGVAPWIRPALPEDFLAAFTHGEETFWVLHPIPASSI